MGIKLLETTSYIVIAMAILVIIFTLFMIGLYIERKLKEQQKKDDLTAYTREELQDEVLEQREHSLQVEKANVELAEALSESEATALKWERRYYDLSRKSKE